MPKSAGDDVSTQIHFINTCIDIDKYIPQKVRKEKNEKITNIKNLNHRPPPKKKEHFFYALEFYCSKFLLKNIVITFLFFQVKQTKM